MNRQSAVSPPGFFAEPLTINVSAYFVYFDWPMCPSSGRCEDGRLQGQLQSKSSPENGYRRWVTHYLAFLCAIAFFWAWDLGINTLMHVSMPCNARRTVHMIQNAWSRACIALGNYNIWLQPLLKVFSPGLLLPSLPYEGISWRCQIQSGRQARFTVARLTKEEPNILIRRSLCKKLGLKLHRLPKGTLYDYRLLKRRENNDKMGTTPALVAYFVKIRIADPSGTCLSKTVRALVCPNQLRYPLVLGSQILQDNAFMPDVLGRLQGSSKDIDRGTMQTTDTSIQKEILLRDGVFVSNGREMYGCSRISEQHAIMQEQLRDRLLHQYAYVERHHVRNDHVIRAHYRRCILRALYMRIHCEGMKRYPSKAPASMGTAIPAYRGGGEMKVVWTANEMGELRSPERGIDREEKYTWVASTYDGSLGALKKDPE
ncbi:hypothetical protein DENSPDRAFT_455819, partial [Dentipellis sp. KUC8613]